MSFKQEQDYNMIFGWALDRAANIRQSGSAGKDYTVEDVLADADKIIAHGAKYILDAEQPQEAN